MPGLTPTFLTLSGTTYTLVDPGGDITIASPASRSIIIAPASGTVIGNGNWTFGGAVTLGNGAIFASTIAPFSGANGDFYNDSTAKTFIQIPNGISEYVSRSLFAQTADSTLANTLVLGNLDGTGVGSKGLPANYFVAGKTIRIEAWGTIANTSTPALIIRLQFGATVLATTGAQTMVTISGTTIWRAHFLVTCRTIGASATSKSLGFFEYFSAATTLNQVQIADQGASFNSTATQLVEVLAQWGTASASNTITCNNLVIEALN
jgi:hypothetical protein